MIASRVGAPRAAKIVAPSTRRAEVDHGRLAAVAERRLAERSRGNRRLSLFSRCVHADDRYPECIAVRYARAMHRELDRQFCRELVTGFCRGPGASPTRKRRAVHAWLLMLQSACGSAVHTTPHTSTPMAERKVGPSDELAMRHPDQLQSPADQRSLGAFELSAVPPPDDGSARVGRKQTRESRAPKDLRPIRIAEDPKPRSHPLAGGEFVLPSGLVVHRVPKRVSVRAVREQQTGDAVWEFVDARGRRLALLKERTFRRAASASAPVLEETTTVRKEARRGDWDATPVRVIVDRFRAEHHIYTLERRASGTGWIWSNLELVNGKRADRTR